MTGTVLFNPYTGKPRHPSDIQSDPSGALIWDGETPLQSASMAKTPAQRQADFKQAMKDAGYVKLEAWVTLEQREKFRRLGGDEWLRKRIDQAKEPTKGTCTDGS